jgi:hypothetical protein
METKASPLGAAERTGTTKGDGVMRAPWSTLAIWIVVAALVYMFMTMEHCQLVLRGDYPGIVRHCETNWEMLIAGRF